ncbi:hypothetical protein ACFL20_05470 [Spirochaetota bacterium]
MNALLKYQIFFAILIVTLTGQSCAHQYGLDRYSQAIERYDTEINKKGYALIRSIYCDIYIENITYTSWEKLLDNEIFIRKNININKYRIPKLFFIHVIIKNTWKNPLVLEKVIIKYNNNILAPLTITEIRRKTKSPMYSKFNFKRILSPIRLLSDKYSIKEIDYEKDIIPLKLKFIPPSDKIIRIIAFDWIPVEERKLKLKFIFDQSGIKKVINFDLKRHEYRTRGEHFKKTPKKKVY